MANTFLKSMGYDVGSSKVEDDQLDFGRSLVTKAARKGVRLMLPIDGVAASEFSDNAEYKTVTLGGVPSGWQLLDIG